MKIECKMEFETRVFSADGELRTHNCEIGQWWSDETCKSVDFDSVIKGMGIPNGEYKVKITLERVDNQ